MSEAYRAKLERVRSWMSREGHGTLILSRLDNLFWLLDADTHVGLNSETGVASVVIGRGAVTLVTSNIESPRLRDEELGGLGLEVRDYPWYEGRADDVIEELIDPDGSTAADTPGTGRAPADLAPLRYALMPAEVERYRRLGADLGAAVGQVGWELERGETEFAIGGRLTRALLARQITPTVLLVAADERGAKYRHPIPTAKPVDERVMLVACGRRDGLIVAVTRLVSFVPVEVDLGRRHEAVCQVDAAFIGHTVPGAVASAIFAAGVAAYAEAGFPEEWRQHHQGGATGYAGRDYKATLTSAQVVQPWQAFAWNPSIAGTKSEDTILATPEGPEIISASPDWPLLEAESAGRRFGRADILVR